MGTKSPSWNIFNTVPRINMSDHKLQPSEKISRDPSPRPAMTAESESVRGREDEWRRDRNADRRRDKERYKETTEQQRDRYYDRGPRARDGERDRRQENRNVRPLSTIENENEKEGDRGVRKGDTFPRIAKNTVDYSQNMLTNAMTKDRRQRRREDGERDGDRQRDRVREEYRGKTKNEVKGVRVVVDEKFQPRDRYRGFETGTQDRRRGVEGDDRKDKYAPRMKDKQRATMGGREPRLSSAETRRDRDRDVNWAQRREGRRDTRSEGELDEREWRKEQVQDLEREELIYQHSRSEGDNWGRRGRERGEYWEQDRYRDIGDRSRQERGREDRYREKREDERRTARDKEAERPRKSNQDDRRREDRYWESDYEQRRTRGQSGEADMAGMSRQSQSNVTPRVPPQAQSSSEWSNGRDKEAKVRRGQDKWDRTEKQRHRDMRSNRCEREVAGQWRMWLEPQREQSSKNSLAEEFVDQETRRSTGEQRKRHVKEETCSSEDTEGVSVDGELEEFWTETSTKETGPGDSEDNAEDSEGGRERARSLSEEGSDTGVKQDRDRVLSGEDGFVTVSSSGDDNEEEKDREEFKDCVEFWDGDPAVGKEAVEESTMGKEETVDEEGITDGRERDTPPKYVFCVIGQTLPRTEQSPVEDETFDDITAAQVQNDLSDTSDQVRELDKEEPSPSGDQSAVDVVKMRNKPEQSYHEWGTIKRDSKTEKLLSQWRGGGKEQCEERGKLSPIPSNPYAEVCVELPHEQIQSALYGLNSGVMSPEEEEAINIQMSEAWAMSKETKRHSQAPHLKWANNVVCEILGQSDEQIAKPQSEEGKVNTQYQKIPEIKTDDAHSEPELEEEEEEGVRDDEDSRSKSYGEWELRKAMDSIGRCKNSSKFFSAAQLYQQYSEAAQNFEILRQSRSDALSVCENTASSPASSPLPVRRPLPPLPPVPHPHSLSHTGSLPTAKLLPLPELPKTEGRPSSPRSSISLSQLTTLWRDLPTVSNNPELQKLTEDQRRLQEVRFEVVTSEASYCRSLDIVVEHFVKSKQLGALLTTQDRNWLFSRLADVRAISRSFLSRLEEKVDSDIMHFTVCDVIARHCQRFKMVYVPYLTNQSYQDATYQRLMNENQGFKRIVEKLEMSPVCQRLPLRSFLVLPFQRITRIKLLVQNIVKRTTPGTAEATQAIKALKLLEKLIQESNDSITQMKSIESLVSLSAKVDFECRTLPLISQSRRLVREGKVTELMDFSLKEMERPVHLHLFNDYLLVSLQKEGGRFTVIDHAPVSDVRAENCPVKLHSLQKNLFRLHMSNRALLLRTDTQSDKLRWISALSRSHPEVDFSGVQDYPQMQCIRAFVAQQPDELSLEKADIILVQQSNDHWVEGTRLSDRHWGWVPETHLETIGNPQIRRRNLLDALKLTTATATV